jgi:hypothetical protein
MQFVCKFALENARNSVLELQKCKKFLGEDPQTPVWNCQSITKSFIIIIRLQEIFNIENQISRKILRHPLPKRQMLRYVPDGCISKPISVLRHH